MGGLFVLVGLARHQPEVQMSHGKAGVEVDGSAVVVRGARAIAGRLATERHEIVSAGVELVELEQAHANALCLGAITGVREQDRL